MSQPKQEQVKNKANIAEDRKKAKTEAEEEEHEFDSWVDEDPCEFDQRMKIHARGLGLFNSIDYPRFRFVTDENDPSLMYYTDPYKFGMFAPKRHWCFLGEITEVVPYFRLMLQVKDRSGEVIPVSFYPDEDQYPLKMKLELIVSSGNLVGQTIALRYGEKHGFMDMTTGFRLEDMKYVKFIPCSLEELYQVELKRQEKLTQLKNLACSYPECKKKSPTVTAVTDASSTNSSSTTTSSTPTSSSTSTPASISVTLPRCANCTLVYYCDRDCQERDWKNGHKKECKIFAHLNDLVLPATKRDLNKDVTKKDFHVPFKLNVYQ